MVSKSDYSALRAENQKRVEWHYEEPATPMRARDLVAILDRLAAAEAENERHRKANLVRTVLDGWDEAADGALTDYINEHGFDPVPWRIAKAALAKAEAGENGGHDQ